MTARKPSNNPADRDERLRQYAELRDHGAPRSEAAHKVGVAYYGAGAAYERWYLADRGLPPPQRGRWASISSPGSPLA